MDLVAEVNAEAVQLLVGRAYDYAQGSLWWATQVGEECQRTSREAALRSQRMLKLAQALEGALK